MSTPASPEPRPPYVPPPVLLGLAPDDAPPLPAPLTTLLGREEHVAAVREAVRSLEVRLVSVIGPGGVGKSRVAIQAATEAKEGFADGVRLIRLATLEEPSFFLPAVARAVGLPDVAGGDPLALLHAALHDRRILLLLDSFDPVMAAAPLLSDLLRACPHLTALVTSRGRLQLRGEQVIRLPPLPVPGPSNRPDRSAIAASPAVQLFVRQGREVRPDFALTPENAAAVAEIVRRLDGLPLAIELAAARLALFTPATLLGRLEQRLPLLTGGARDLPDRLRTMRGAIAWSYGLLDPAEQAVFGQLAVFAGGFPIEGAAAVCDLADPLAAMERVGSLLDKSLLGQEETAAGEPRYAMLETVREFGLEALAASGEADATRRRHAAWCLRLAEEAAAARVAGPVRVDWLERLEPEHDNMRAALAWLEADGNVEGLVRLAGALGWFWLYHSHRSEGRGWLERANAAAAAAGLRSAALARALDGAAVLAFSQGDYARAEAAANDYLALSRELDDSWSIAASLNLLGVIDRARGRYDAATPRFEEALSRFRELNQTGWAALALLNLGALAYCRGRLDLAETLLTEAGALYRRHGDAYGMAVAASDLALVAIDNGDRPRATALLAESLERWRELGTKEGLIDWLARVASLALTGGDAERAVRLFGTVEAARSLIGYHFEEPERARQRRALDAARARLGAEAFDAALAAGDSCSFVEALADASTFLAGTAAPPAPVAPTDGTGQAGLTVRELEVLRLVAAGFSDRQIGASLSISHRTVMRHVEHILGKLDVDSRTAAAAQAIRLGLA